jgi:hypothetical protein
MALLNFNRIQGFWAFLQVLLNLKSKFSLFNFKVQQFEWFGSGILKSRYIYSLDV